MLMYLRVLCLCMLFPLMTGCTGIMKYIERLQAQSVDEYEQRSANFQPKFQFQAPAREELTAEEKRLIGAPPPQQGEVILDGVRYYSGNGYICQYFTQGRGRNDPRPKSACWINGRWVLAAPVVNTEPAKF